MKPASIPPTRNHRQLAAWINSKRVYDRLGRRVVAIVDSWRASTDRPAGRLRIAGKGRDGLRLRIRAEFAYRDPDLFEHKSSETYRTHQEARDWVAQNLHMARPRLV